MPFIDEAYSLTPTHGPHDYGAEALATLVEEMETHRDRLVVVLAGYPKQMTALLAANEGLHSRVGRTITFADLDRDELRAVALLLAADRGQTLEPAAADAVAAAADALRGQKDFANARTVRNLIERAIHAQARRIAPLGAQVSDEDLTTLRAVDVPAVSAVTEQFGLYL